MPLTYRKARGVIHLPVITTSKLLTRRDAAESIPLTPQEIEQLEKLLNTPQTAAVLSISKRSLQELVAERKIGFIKFGRNIRFSRADIERFIESHRCQPVGWKSEANRRAAR
jgi:excisionase family DNA binding protein